MITLPTIMAAPNGARRGKADHPALPVNHAEIIDAALACRAAGAGAVHIHVRDGAGLHVLDAGRYRAVLADLARRAPDLIVQVTTESVGRYTPDEQMKLVRDLRPRSVSVALREIAPSEDDEAAARDFFSWCAGEGIAVQHILYHPAEVERLARLVRSRQALSALFVLGRYGVDAVSTPSDLGDFLTAGRHVEGLDWMACAFGISETDCLAAALRRGGKVRVGFENNLLHVDGTLAASNAERVAAIARIALDIAVEGAA